MTGNLPRLTPTSEFHVAFRRIPVYDFITILCRKKAKIENYAKEYIPTTGQGEAQHVKYKKHLTLVEIRTVQIICC
jgi:hypothetical protein